MQATETVRSLSSIIAVAVLYNCAFSQSESLTTLCEILGQDRELAKDFSLVLYDNSPQPQSFIAPASFAIHYVHDPSNGGLATAYNFALAQAEAQGRAWLLLLDQDTSLTREFITELADATEQAAARVGAIVPKLLVKGKVYSPENNFVYQLRHPHQRFRPVETEVVGVQERHLNAYNSGATLRASALRSAGGFPTEFWLDYLDHAIFQTLFDGGYRVCVMNAQLRHDSSLADYAGVPLWRLRNILQAQTLFVKQNGNFLDHLLYRLFLLRFSRGLWKHRKDSRFWKEVALQALLLRVREMPRPGRSTPAT